MQHMEDRWRQVKLKVWGDYACFTRPEMKVERVSYDVMTPSAARGILEAILWKPAIRWQVEQIDVLRPIKMTSVRRNEVSEVVSVANVKKAMNAGRGDLHLYVEDARQQRAGLILRDAAYTIHARFELTDRAGSDDSVQKFSQMFRRRAAKGQCFHRPYLGCREFEASFELIDFDDEPPGPIDHTADLGWMLYDFDYDNDLGVRFFQAKLDQGVMMVPPRDSGEVVG